jgi:hypothetical protein
MSSSPSTTSPYDNPTLSYSRPARIIFFIDVLTLLVGFAVLGISIWAWIEFSTFEIFMSLRTIGIGIGIGIGLILTSLLGISGSTRGNKIILGFYFIVLIACFSLQVVGCSEIVHHHNLIVEQNSYKSADSTVPEQVDLNNAILSVYTSCCTGCPVGAQCNQITPNIAQLLPNCLTLNPNYNVNNNAGDSSTNNQEQYYRTCSFAVPCSTLSEDGCYTTTSTTTKSIVNIPTFHVNTRLCETLATTNYGGSYLVSTSIPTDGSKGGCGGGHPSIFLHDMIGYLSTQYLKFMIVFIVFALLQVCNMLCVLYVEFCWVPSTSASSTTSSARVIDHGRLEPKIIRSSDNNNKANSSNNQTIPENQIEAV